jgi:hypothetical protein
MIKPRPALFKWRHFEPTGGNQWLPDTLTECAWAAAAKKNCFLKDKFWRITTKSGGKKSPAVVAIAHTLLILTYKVLSTANSTRTSGCQFSSNARSSG